MQTLPVTIQTIFAELTERIAAREAARSVAHLSGSFAAKTVSGQRYWYFKSSQPGAGQLEYYLGAASPALNRLMDAHREGRSEKAAEDSETASLCSMLRSGGANVLDATAARVLRALSDAGVFRLGGMLVGTYGYVVLGNVLGVRWQRATRTQDLDIAARASLAVAVPTIATDAPGILDSLQMGFLPVPGLDPGAPSTSFKVRGRQLRVDFLTPQFGRQRPGPVSIPRLGVAATPLPLLDYLIDSRIETVAVNGSAVPVSVPDPARYALHKLVVADRRPVAQQGKAAKDRDQARELLSWLEQERPGDIELALTAARDHYRAVHAGIRKAARRLEPGPLRDRLAGSR